LSNVKNVRCVQIKASYLLAYLLTYLLTYSEWADDWNSRIFRPSINFSCIQLRIDAAVVSV